MTNPKHTSSDLVERLRKATDTDGLWDAMMRQRKETRSDLPRMNMENTIDLLDEERAEAATALEALAAENGALRSALASLIENKDRHPNEAHPGGIAGEIAMWNLARATLNGEPQP